MKGLIITLIVALVTLAGPALAGPEVATGPIVELNRATVEELQSLPGIGLKKAEAIIAQREKRPFTRVTQLLLVKGIGQKTLTRLKPRLAVRPVGSVGPATPAAGATPDLKTRPAKPGLPEPVTSPSPGQPEQPEG